MKLETVKSRLGSSVLRAEKIVGKNMNLPVLSCLYLEAKKEGLVIKATNLDLGIELTVAAKVSKEGVVTVPAQTLSSLLNTIKDDEKIELELKDSVLHITTETSSSHINTIPSDDFPTIPRIKQEKDNSFEFDSETLVDGFKSVWTSAAVSSIKPELSSVYMYSNESGELVFVATDSFRLAEKRIKFSKGGLDDGILIPVKNIIEITRLLDGGDSGVVMLVDDGQIGFTTNDMYITSRIVDGTFPNYKQIIPDSFETTTTLLKEDIFDALKMVNIFSDKFNKITLSVIPNKKQLTLSTKNNDVGDTTKTLDATTDGSELTINFNYKYIIDGFSSLSPQSTLLQFNGPQKPMVITGKGDDSFLYLVMPMNK